MLGLQVLHQDKGHPRIQRQSGQKFRESFQSAGRCSNTYDRESPSSRLRGAFPADWRFGRNSTASCRPTSSYGWSFRRSWRCSFHRISPSVDADRLRIPVLQRLSQRLSRLQRKFARREVAFVHNEQVACYFKLARGSRLDGMPPEKTFDFDPQLARADRLAHIVGESVEAFLLKRFSEQFKKEVKGITRRGQILLARHSWPGNIRELENALGHACMMTMSDMIDVEDLPIYKAEGRAQAAAASSGGMVAALDTSGSLDEHEKLLLTDALERACGNQSEAARILRISRDRIRYKMAKYNLHPNSAQ